MWQGHSFKEIDHSYGVNQMAGMSVFSIGKFWRDTVNSTTVNMLVMGLFVWGVRTSQRARSMGYPHQDLDHWCCMVRGKSFYGLLGCERWHIRAAGLSDWIHSPDHVFHDGQGTFYFCTGLDNISENRNGQNNTMVWYEGLMELGTKACVLHCSENWVELFPLRVGVVGKIFWTGINCMGELHQNSHHIACHVGWMLVVWRLM